MFIPIKSTDGAMTPFEYIEAAAGTYQVGQLLNVTDGKLGDRCRPGDHAALCVHAERHGGRGRAAGGDARAGQVHL